MKQRVPIHVDDVEIMKKITKEKTASGAVRRLIELVLSIRNIE